MRARKSTDHFDLLPFIAILMCTLGTLLLVTLCMATVNLGPGAGEGWIPTIDPNRKVKTPILFQWDGDVLIVQRGKETLRIDIPFEKYLAAPNRSDEEKAYKEQMESGVSTLKSEILDGLQRDRETHYALFAIRPSGFKSFGQLRSLFEERKITIGKEPIEQGKPVRLATKEFTK